MRKPLIAGTWYPDNAQQIEELFSPWAERPQKDLRPSALILPHAGYAFSGSIAAEACSRVDPEQYKKIIILAPSHTHSFTGSVSVEPAGEVETPFGPVRFSPQLHEALSSLPNALFIPEAHKREHSIDIQLPLLKRFFPQCEVGALITGDFVHARNTEDARKKTAQALRSLFDRETLVVVSTDFTHYGKRFGYLPFTDNIPANMEDLDRRAYEAFAVNDPEIFLDFMRYTRATVCGASALLLLLETLPAEAEFTRIDYANSGMLTGDWGNCVGYTATAVTADWSLSPEKSPSRQGTAPISCRTGRLLPILARRHLRRQFGLPVNDTLPSLDSGMFSELQQHRAVFVTLTIRGRLRGCIGELLPMRPLWSAVTGRSVSAAFEDPRFSKLSREELDHVSIEVSVLTPPVPISSAQEIVLGRHGVILQKRGRQAVFLPQVAAEQGWDLKTMLSHLAVKAGLSPDDWKEGCSFLVFTAQIFHELK